jgi:hypothetical protein
MGLSCGAQRLPAKHDDPGANRFVGVRGIGCHVAAT